MEYLKRAIAYLHSGGAIALFSAEFLRIKIWNLHHLKESQKSILNNLSIREVVVGLDHASDLMFLAYNALAKNALQRTVFTLQYELLKATSEASSTMVVFKDQSDNVAQNLLSA